MLPIVFYLLYTAYQLLIDCLLVNLDAHIFNHEEYRAGTQAQLRKLRAPGPGPYSLWALVPGPGPIAIMVEHMCIEANQ